MTKSVCTATSMSSMTLLTTNPTPLPRPPSVVPASSSPVGALAQPRRARAARAWVRSERRFTFTPTVASPTLLPLNRLVTRGKSGTTPPTRT